jgi:hypothetical protein
LAYCTLPAICLLTGQFITPEVPFFQSLILLYYGVELVEDYDTLRLLSFSYRAA